MSGVPRPFLKWVGGKGQLLPQLEPLYPKAFKGYHEPFVGGGAVFYSLASLVATKTVSSPFSRVHLGDCNEELVNAYNVVRDQLPALKQILKKHASAHNEAHYYATRAKDVSKLTPVARAARILYLNRTCFNGLYRVNQKGGFNVPIGSYKNPKIYEPDRLDAASSALQTAQIHVESYLSVEKRAKKGDFIYFDPPYDPLTKTANFTSYTTSGFGDADQEELAELFARLDEKGCLVLLSNSYTPFMRRLYKKFTLRKVSARRAINSKASARGAITELLVSNY